MSIKIVVPPGHKIISCPSCGGYGGEPGSNFGDYGWHSCYKCGELGVLVVPEDYDSDWERHAEQDREQTLKEKVQLPSLTSEDVPF